MVWTVAKGAGAVAFTNWLARDGLEAGQPSFYQAREPNTLKRAAETADPFSADLGPSTVLHEDLLDRLPMMVHIIDGQGRIQSTNEATGPLLGFPRDSLIGRPALGLLTEPSRKRVIEHALPEFYRAGQVSNVDVEFATRSGGTVDCLMSAMGYRTPQGRIARTVAVFADMSQRAAALAALGRAEQRLLTAEANLWQAQQELNDLLTVVIGNLQLIQDAMEGNEKAEKRAREAFLAAVKVSQFTKQLLDLAFPAVSR